MPNRAIRLVQQLTYAINDQAPRPGAILVPLLEKLVGTHRCEDGRIGAMLPYCLIGTGPELPICDHANRIP